MTCTDLLVPLCGGNGVKTVIGTVYSSAARVLGGAPGGPLSVGLCDHQRRRLWLWRGDRRDVWPCTMSCMQHLSCTCQPVNVTDTRWAGKRTCTERWCSHNPLKCIVSVQTSELYQWNEQQAGLPLEWPAAAQLGGVIALSQRSGRSDIVIGGFAGCAQVREGLAAPCWRRCVPSRCVCDDYQACRLAVIQLGRAPSAHMRLQRSRPV